MTSKTLYELVTSYGTEILIQEENISQIASQGQAAEKLVCDYLRTGTYTDVKVNEPGRVYNDLSSTPEEFSQSDRFIFNKSDTDLENALTSAWKKSCMQTAAELANRLPGGGQLCWHDGIYKDPSIAEFIGTVNGITKGTVFGNRNRWNPADLWYFSSKDKIKEAVSVAKNLEGNSPEQKLSFFTEWLDSEFEKQNIIGISLKKLKTSKANLKNATVVEIRPDKQVIQYSVNKQLVPEGYRISNNSAEIYLIDSVGTKCRLRIILTGTSYVKDTKLSVCPKARIYFIFDHNKQARVGSLSVPDEKEIGAIKPVSDTESQLVVPGDSEKLSVFKEGMTVEEYLKNMVQEITQDGVLDSIASYISSTYHYKNGDLTVKSANHWRVETGKSN